MGNASYNKKMMEYIDKQRYDGVVRIIEVLNIKIKNYPAVLDEDLSSEVHVTPLARAVWRNDLELTDILIKRGANVNNGGSEDITPLMWAAKRDNAYLVSNLIDQGADMSLRSHEGFSALDYAIVHGNYRPALFLYEFTPETLNYQDYYQFAKTRDYRYVNYEIFLTHLKQKTSYSAISNIFAKPEKRRLIDPVIDPRESWKQMVHRMIEFQEPPQVERAELPEDLQPQNRFWGKLRQSINGLQVEPLPRQLEPEEGTNLKFKSKSLQNF